MNVRPRCVLSAVRIETAEQARQVTILPQEMKPKGWAAFIGDWLITTPEGERFIWPDASFEDTYEVVDPV